MTARNKRWLSYTAKISLENSLNSTSFTFVIRYRELKSVNFKLLYYVNTAKKAQKIIFLHSNTFQLTQKLSYIMRMVLSGKDYTKISNKKMKGTQKGQRYDLPHLVSLYSVEKKIFF